MPSLVLGQGRTAGESPTIHRIRPINHLDKELEIVYVYVLIRGSYSVGFYLPTSGLWIEESVQSTADAAAARVSYLNGGAAPE